MSQDKSERDSKYDELLSVSTARATANMPELEDEIAAHILMTVLATLSPLLNMGSASPEVLELKRRADAAHDRAVLLKTDSMANVRSYKPEDDTEL